LTGQPIARRLAERILEEGGDEAVLDRVADGESVVEIAKDYKVSRSTLMRWLKKDDGRHEAYQEAKSESADALVEEAGDILDNASTESGPHVQKAKSRAEHKRWLASKRDRVQYGDDAKALIAVNVDLSSLHLDALREVGHMSQIPEAVVLDDGGADDPRPSVRGSPSDGAGAGATQAEE
jgi:transposase-like protein